MGFEIKILWFQSQTMSLSIFMKDPCLQTIIHNMQHTV